MHSEIEDYEKELRKAELELEQLMSRKEWIDWISVWGESLKVESKTKENKKKWLQGIIDKIVVYSEEGLNRDEKTVQV